MKTAVLFLLIHGSGSAQSPQLWSQGDPSAEEQAALEWLNAARKEPVATLTRILNQANSDPVIAGFLLAQQPVTAAQLQAQLSGTYAEAKANSAQFPGSSAISNAPLVFYPLFQARARALGAQSSPPATDFPALRPPPAYIYPVPSFGSALMNGPDNVLTGPNATGGTAQFGPFGANYAEISQANLYAAYITGREWALTLLTTPRSGSPPPSFLVQGDPVPGFTLGHRRMAGLSITGGQNGGRILTLYQGSNEFFTVSDLPFGNTDTVFITGVAYRDANGNGAYDPGEGVGNVKVTTDRGNWSAVTSASGGYAIPVAVNSGDYRLIATGGPWRDASATVTVGSDSVKVDWVAAGATPVLPVQVPVAASDGAAQLTGLSTRGLVQIGANVLIGGIVLAGDTNVKKRVLIRGVGPSLQTVGLPPSQCVPATQLVVFNAAGQQIAANNGWTTAADSGVAVADAAAQVGDFPLTNWAGGGGDSALVTALSPGAYTVIVSPAPGLPEVFQIGHVGLVEIYDLTPSDGSRFVNISTRALVGTGFGQLIVGCTISGSGHKRLLIRGVGPTLAQTFGLANALPHPALTLFDSGGHPLAGNADWNNSEQTNQIRDLALACGAFLSPEDATDAALITRVVPGNYSAVVAAQPSTILSGIALVELYETP